MEKKQRKNKILSKFLFFDIFGYNPQFYTDNEKQYKTFIGALFSIFLLEILFVSCWVYGNDIYYKQNPIVSFQEEFSMQPEHFKINKDTLNFS